MSEYIPEKGDWILMNFGFQEIEFYVLSVSPGGTRVKLGHPEWLVSSSKWFDLNHTDLKKAVYLGRGRLRLWRFLLPWMDLVAPYSKPEPNNA